MFEERGPEEALPWFAVKVRARSEKLIASILEQKGYTTFVPLYQTRKVWSDRVIPAELPLFPGYLFCQIDPNSYWIPVLQTPGAKSFVSFGGVLAEVDRREIDSLRIAMKSGRPLQPWPYLRAGQRVVVERGAFEGMEGILLRTKGQDRLILSVTLLQRSVAVEIERCWVRPAPPARPPVMIEPVRLQRAC
jgi:transcription antitermination factor NusG